jgi:hypothetical protein
VRFGRKVEANGARVVRRATAVAVLDFGNEARLYLAAFPPVLIKRLTAELTALCVEYHRPLF